MLKHNTIRRAAIAAVILTAVSAQATGPKKKMRVPLKPAPKVHVQQAYFGGHLVNFRSPETKSGKVLAVGPWSLGPRVSPGPSDKRPNLYFVSPGMQHQIPGKPEFNHNAVLSAVPEGESSFDVFWVLVLDPSVKEDFTSEQQIIMATQEEFTPPDDFTFEQLPSAGFLKTFLKKVNMQDLDDLRRPDGGLPKVAIVRAGITVKAVAEEIEPAPVATEEAKKPGE